MKRMSKGSVTRVVSWSDVDGAYGKPDAEEKHSGILFIDYLSRFS